MSFKSIAQLGAAAIVASALVSCGTQTQSMSGSSADVDDPSYFYDQVQQVQGLELNMLEPANLAAALPGVPAVKGKVEEGFSEVVVVGAVEGVEAGVGYIYSDNGEETKETSFDDPTADARDVLVRLTVADAVGVGKEQAVEFRMGVLLDADPEKFMASLRGLDQVAVLLDTIPDGTHAGELYPIMSGAGVAQVEDDGTLVFPGLGAQERSFAGTIQTAPALLNAAGS